MRTYTKVQNNYTNKARATYVMLALASTTSLACAQSPKTPLWCAGWFKALKRVRTRRLDRTTPSQQPARYPETSMVPPVIGPASNKDSERVGASASVWERSIIRRTNQDCERTHTDRLASTHTANSHILEMDTNQCESRQKTIYHAVLFGTSCFPYGGYVMRNRVHLWKRSPIWRGRGRPDKVSPLQGVHGIFFPDTNA